MNGVFSMTRAKYFVCLSSFGGESNSGFRNHVLPALCFACDFSASLAQWERHLETLLYIIRPLVCWRRLSSLLLLWIRSGSGCKVNDVLDSIRFCVYSQNPISDTSVPVFHPSAAGRPCIHALDDKMTTFCFPGCDGGILCDTTAE